MKTLAKLQHTKTLWVLLLLCTAFFLLRLPSVIEPYWYGDEGIYEVIGQSLNHGHLLYRAIWDNKPPLLYWLYAIANGDLQTVKMLSLISGLLSVIAFFLLIQKLFKKLAITTIITAIYVFLFATPLVEGNIANAENFMLFPIILAGFIMYQFTIKQTTQSLNKNFPPLIAGFLLGIAFLFKIVAIFDFATFFLFLLFLKFPKKISLMKTGRDNGKKILLHDFRFLFFFTSSFLLPIIVTTAYFFFQGTIQEFVQSAFFGNVDYVGWKNTFFGIPQGLLLLKVCLLIITVFVIFFTRNYVSKPILFVALWIVFSLFNASFSGRPYTHYLLVLLPSFCLLLGLLLASQTVKKRFTVFASIVGIVFVLLLQFPFQFTKSYLYYPNALQFVTGNESVDAYQAFFDSKTIRNPIIASFITHHTIPSDTVFIWGNSPQIYALAQRLPSTRYTVDYHITHNVIAMKQTKEALVREKPKYIIVLEEAPPLPFSLSHYIMRFSIPSFSRVGHSVPGATIYERSL